jgi:putative transposase
MSPELSNGVYTQRFNRAHGVDGQLFRGQYKSILVDEDAYLLQLVRYIHRNPFCAGLANSPRAYEWSSHRGYLSQAKKWDWLFKDYILSMLSKSPRDRISAYRDFMAQEDSEEIRSLFQRKKWPSVLGSGRFIRWVRGRYFMVNKDDEIPQAKELAPSMDDIKKAVCEYYGVIDEQLFSSRRGQFNEPRNVAIYLTRLLRTDSLRQIADHYQIAKYSSVSSVIERMKRFRVEDKKLRKRVQVVQSRISKGQEQT